MPVVVVVGREAGVGTAAVVVVTAVVVVVVVVVATSDECCTGPATTRGRSGTPASSTNRMPSQDSPTATAVDADHAARYRPRLTPDRTTR
ncbi:hypothetical protein GCM10010185_41460 [Saccharothrix coeruleofusca]|uniref:Uncharacterized protein n=1 Tax=Saccharothrix coeruleofusca TaxID=33919 RepID=A0A918EEC7_9PSEU|nr:hypothetical protein GCM10010185_41460 [Saccharothrix coeruleofusca]